MSGFVRLVVVTGLLAVVFGGVAVVAGYPSRLTGGESDAAGGGHGEAAHADSEGAGAEALAAEALPGVQVAQDGLRLVVEHSRVTPGGPSAPISFRILDLQGRAVRDFEVEHERKMHFIVVRRDLTSFQHLHPTMKPDGTWSTAVDFGDGGTYRVFADFTRDGEQRTLGADVQVGGLFRPRPLPAPAQVARSDGGLEVVLRAEAAGEDTRLEFEVRDEDRVVTDRLQPYLGARGHLVTLREGDLAYLHTHPAGDELAFTLDYPSAGAYRLFVQF